jgi:hypothetical protein
LVLRHLVHAIRTPWPRVNVLVRWGSQCGRHKARSWCERNRVASIFGLAGNKALIRQVAG